MKTGKIPIWISTALLSLLLCGCETPDANFYPLTADRATRFGEPRAADKVQLYITKKPAYKYRELGMITFDTPSSFADEPKIYEIMRKKAGEIGADGLIIMTSQSTVEQLPQITLDYYGNPTDGNITRSYIKYRGMAIERTK